jgi:short-subunit dehydrogenase
VLINNAGIMPIGPFAEEDDATARRMIDINLHGVIYGTKLAIPPMVQRGTGHIVNIASQAGKAGIPGGATYCATKHAVVGLSEAVRAELRGTGVEVSVVMPAVVNTELGSGLPDTPGVKKLEPEEVADEIVSALKFPKFDVWVPRSSAAISTVMQLLPRRGREAIGRLLNVDKVLAEPDKGARAAYEERAAYSEPGLEPDKVEAGSTEEQPESAARG